MSLLHYLLFPNRLTVEAPVSLRISVTIIRSGFSKLPRGSTQSFQSGEDVNVTPATNRCGTQRQYSVNQGEYKNICRKNQSKWFTMIVPHIHSSAKQIQILTSRLIFPLMRKRGFLNEVVWK
jgi:hypothetical protein